MKEVCLCIHDGNVHSVGLWNKESGKYYSEEAGGCFDLSKNTHLFEYKEISFIELRRLLTLSLNTL
jgi:hypothetical protein